MFFKFTASIKFQKMDFLNLDLQFAIVFLAVPILDQIGTNFLHHGDDPEEAPPCMSRSSTCSI